MCNGREDIDHQEREALWKYMLDTNICIYAYQTKARSCTTENIETSSFRYMYFINYIC